MSFVFRALVIGAVCSSMMFAPSVFAQTKTSVSTKTLKQALGDSVVRAQPGKKTQEILGRLMGDVQVAPVPPAVLAAVQSSNWAAASKAFEGASVSVEKTPYLAFLKGYVLVEHGKHAQGLALLSALVKRKDFLLQEEAAYYAQLAAFKLAKYEDVATFSTLIASKSRLNESASLLHARALLANKQDKDAPKVIEIYKGYLKRYPRSGSATGVALKLASLYESRGAWAKALDAYEHVLMNRPLDTDARHAQAGVKKALRKVKASQRKAYQRNEAKRQTALVYRMYRRHRSEKIIARRKTLLKQVTGSTSQCEMLYYIARSYSKLRQHPESTPWYARIIKTCQDSPKDLVRALYLGGKANWNAEKRAEAKKLYKQLWLTFPKHRYADDSMFFSARILREEKKSKEAQSLLRKQVKTYPDGDMAKDARWLLVRSWFAQKDYKKIVDYVDETKDAGERDLYSQGRLAYFAARARLKLGKKSEALKAFKKIIRDYPVGYYAFLSFQAINKLNGKKTPPDLCKLSEGKLCDRVDGLTAFNPEQIIKEELINEPSIVQGVALLRLGLDKWAGQSFKRAVYKYRKNQDALWALAWMLDAAGVYPISHDIPRRSMKSWKTAYPQLENRAKWEVAYPRPFYRWVKHFGKARKVPEALIYAIMREESGFSPRIESWANAKGLMQLMDKTAGRMAEVDAVKDFKHKQLFKPQTNIRLGSRYLAELSGQFLAHPALIIAGYNGGFGNVGRWLKARGHLPLDLWVEDIPYGQTRNYTKRVLTTFWAYSWLYGSVRTPILPSVVKTK